MATGDEALAGNEEKDIQIYRFPPMDTDRTIFFKGRYIAIYNEATQHRWAYEDHDTPTTEYKEFKVPAHYTCYIRVASVYFKPKD